jgi:hypothetical protein
VAELIEVAMRTIYVRIDTGADWAAWLAAIGSIVCGLAILVLLVLAFKARSTLKSTLEEIRLAAKQVKVSEKGENVSLVVEIVNRWNGAEFIAARRTFGDKTTEEVKELLLQAPDDDVDDPIAQMVQMVNFFETIGVLVQVEAFDVEMVQVLLGTYVTRMWDNFEEFVLAMRHDVEDSYMYWERLVTRLREHSAGLSA